MFPLNILLKIQHGNEYVPAFGQALQSVVIWFASNLLILSPIDFLLITFPLLWSTSTDVFGLEWMSFRIKCHSEPLMSDKVFLLRCEGIRLPMKTSETPECEPRRIHNGFTLMWLSLLNQGCGGWFCGCTQGATSLRARAAHNRLLPEDSRTVGQAPFNAFCGLFIATNIDQIGKRGWQRMVTFRRNGPRVTWAEFFLGYELYGFSAGSCHRTS